MDGWYDERLDRMDALGDGLEWDDVDEWLYHLMDLNIFVDNEGDIVNIHDYLTPSELYLYRADQRRVFYKSGFVIMVDGYVECDFYGCAEEDPLYQYYLRRSENPESARCYL